MAIFTRMQYSINTQSEGTMKSQQRSACNNRPSQPTVTVRASWLALCLFLVGVCLTVVSAEAQTEIRISGPQSGFPVAIPQLCDGGGAQAFNAKIAELIASDLELSGYFNVLNRGSYIETPGKCGESFAYSDWSVIGAEGLVKGEVTRSGGGVRVKLFLYDVLKQQAVFGKQYDADESEVPRLAHKFANEIIRFFTGEPGIFGTQIAYVSRVGRFKELFVMDLDGSNQRQLTRDKGLAVSPSWSPAGDLLVYTSYRTRQPELYTINPNGGSPRQLTNRPGLEIGAKFMKDGGSIISGATFDGNTNLVLFDLRGQLISKLTTSPGIDVSPSLSPDGSQVAFTSNRGGGPQVFVMPSSGGAGRRISFTGSNYCTSPAWSPKGDKIVFVCLSGGNQLFITSPSGGQATQLTFGGNNEDPAWSPDGRYIAYSQGGGGAKRLMILALVSGRSKEISTQARGEDSQPAWSPAMN